MRLSDFDYSLPPGLIAQAPARPRDHSRLLIMDKKTGQPEHKFFYDLPGYLKKGDVLVLNNSKVFPARLIGRKKETGGKIEVFLLRETGGGTWQCLLGGRGGKEGLAIGFGRGLDGRVIRDNQDGTWETGFNKSGRAFMDIVGKVGFVPLPPYIKRGGGRRTADGGNYQTVYADDKKTGSVAAPTAGLHFTPGLLKKIKKAGAEIIYVTLHVGLGTFAPVKIDNVAGHKMHAEYVEIEKDAIGKIVRAKKEGRRVIAAGTTSARALESVFGRQAKARRGAENRKFEGWTDIFIYPGYKFMAVDALITNFHLPKSTLLMLVSAFAGREKITRAYREAIKRKYRFYSYGDAMFIR